MNVRDIVERFLRESGYDGLLNSDGDCGCQLSDLVPCGQIQEECEPGYKQPCTAECDHGYEAEDGNWHISRTKG